MSDTNPDIHINDGIQKSIKGQPDVNWVKWAEHFPKRIPVIFLDGFDESSMERNPAYALPSAHHGVMAHQRDDEENEV